jgi:putative PIN family toxin of toxin-antitoxin system
MSAPRIVLDTNVLISAIVFGGRPREVLEKVIAGRFTMAISAEMLAEFQWVLEGRKFRYPAAIVQNIVTELLSVSELVRPTMQVEQIKADPADNRILECALESRATCIVTGDRHLLELGKYEGIPILEVAAFLANE